MYYQAEVYKKGNSHPSRRYTALTFDGLKEQVNSYLEDNEYGFVKVAAVNDVGYLKIDDELKDLLNIVKKGDLYIIED